VNWTLLWRRINRRLMAPWRWRRFGSARRVPCGEATAAAAQTLTAEALLGDPGQGAGALPEHPPPGPLHLPPVVSEAPRAERARFVFRAYALLAVLSWLVIAIFVGFRAVLENGAGPMVRGGVELVCHEEVIWSLFLAVMVLAGHQRLWLMRHAPPPPRLSLHGLGGLAAPPLSTRPRRHAAIKLHWREFQISWWLFVVAMALSMAWFPCVCAPPFYRMALHGTLAASAVYTLLAILALTPFDVQHSAPMLAISLLLMVTTAYVSTVAAGASSADVVVGAVGMAVFYWAIVLSFSSVVHLVPSDAPVLALGLVVADAFLYNAVVWAYAHARRTLGRSGPHALAHADAVIEIEEAACTAEESWRRSARNKSESQKFEHEIEKRRYERNARILQHASQAEALDLDVYWPRLDLSRLYEEGFIRLVPDSSLPNSKVFQLAEGAGQPGPRGAGDAVVSVSSVANAAQKPRPTATLSIIRAKY